MEQDNFYNNNSPFKNGFSGDRRYFKGFLAKIELVFMLIMSAILVYVIRHQAVKTFRLKSE